MREPRPEAGTVRVWDPVVRLSHWALVIAGAGAWWAGESHLALHLLAGYTVSGVMALRLLWGVVGGWHARWRDFVRAPRTVRRYAVLLLRGRGPRYLGHNPLGGWMVLLLLALLATVCVSGWLCTTDAFWGFEGLERLHRGSAWALLGCAGLHVAGVLFTSWRQRENLVAAMFTGRKPARPQTPGALEPPDAGRRE